MKSGVGFLAFRLYRWASVLLVILLSLLVVSCDLWNKDMLGYLEHWSETVQLGKVEVSDATIQKNDSGVDTISLSATPTIAAYVINPKSYELLAEIGDSSSSDRSVRISSQSVQTKAQVVAHESTLLKIQLGSADGSLEHTEFRVDFEAIRKDTMQSSRQVMGVTLQYNTPPVAPTPVVWNYDSNQYEVVKAGEKWEADRGGILYWAYDDSITKETDPNCAKWFSIGGTRHLVADCKVDPNVKVDGLSVFQFKTNYGSISVTAVDSEGVSSPAVASGQAVPPATYVIKYDANGATGGTAPTSQNKTQYTDITLATNSGGLTRIGYRFTGWNTDPDGAGTSYSEGATYSNDASVTLYAQWDPNTYTVLFDPNGGLYGAVNYPTQQFTYDRPQALKGNTFTPSTDSVFTGKDYIFAGWNTQANGGGTSYTDTERVSNLTANNGETITLFAQWKIANAVFTLDASKISSADDLRTVLASCIDCEITVNLGGKLLEVTNSDLATNKEFFTVKDGNKVTINSGTVEVTGDFSTSSTSDDFLLFSVEKESTLDLSGCTLTGTDFRNAGVTAVKVSNGGSLTLTDTTISNFDSNSTGAGVYVGGGGSATMNSGAIKNNYARYGAAVYLAGSFTMNGGEISGNTNVNGSSISGGGTFKWNGGTISNNRNSTAEGGSVFGSDINYGGTKDKNDAS